VILFVSPHLDDVALSCGGFVARLAAGGQPVMIATLCTADAPDGEELSEAAQHVHWEWQLGEQPYARRREEDITACKSLGVQPLHLDMLDAVYRHDDAGLPLYMRDFIGGRVREADWQHHLPAVKAVLREPLRSASQVYSPLGIGGHVDHVIIRRAVEELADEETPLRYPLHYYEDFPYAGKAREFEGTPVMDGLAPALIPLSEDEIEARIRAIACYPSQMFALFGKADAMPARVRNYVARAGGERYWVAIDAYRQDG
jgi:LmbE family N-acetylglucosaminyl deacetylase